MDLITKRNRTEVVCSCGSVYERYVRKFPVKDTDQARCTVCGAVLESWSRTTAVPGYDLIKKEAA